MLNDANVASLNFRLVIQAQCPALDVMVMVIGYSCGACATHSNSSLEVSGGDHRNGSSLLSKLPLQTLLHRHCREGER